MCDLLVYLNLYGWMICSYYEFASERKFIWHCINQNQPPNLCLKAEIKSTPLILQTAKESCKGNPQRNGTLSEIDTLRLWYTFGLAIFFKFGFLGQNSGRRLISNFWKNFLKKAKYWPYGAYAINRDDFRGNYLYGCHELTTQLISIVVLTTQHFWY